MKIATIIGARPQFIKAAALSRSIATNTHLCETLIHTGQHFDDNMSRIFFEELEIPEPKYNLNINSTSHGKMTGQMIIEIESILNYEKPDFVLVYGDTNSTLAGAIAATKMHLPLAHVEAGLRSFNKKMPEEINRILTDHSADLLFTPTDAATNNLLAEGIQKNKIYNVGDIMYDTALHATKHNNLNRDKILTENNLTPIRYILATIHRAENTGDLYQLETLIDCLNSAAEHFPVIIPMHPNTRKLILKNNISSKLSKNIKTIEPVSYFTMQYLIRNSFCVLTDSGGLQKEAYFNNKVCLTLRKVTEWTELVQNNWNYLVENDSNLIHQALEEFPSITRNKNVALYGDGKTAEKIISTLMQAQNAK